MASVAALPAAGLIAGAAAGLLLPSSLPSLPSFLPSLPSLPAILLSAFLPCIALLSLWAWRAERPRLLGACVAFGFFAGGVLLASDAWQRAWRPPLRIAFEAIAHEQRAQAAAEGRRLPEDDEAFVRVEGQLRSDASLGPTGVSLSLDVDRLAGQDGQAGQGRRAGGAEHPASGGIVVTVVGSLAAARMDAWRAGRRVRLPVTLRRPPRYLDPGVPDHERALARHGTTLVGTVKSGALVDVLARAGWFDEAVSAARAFARRAIAGGVGRWSPQSSAIVAAIVIGDRAGLDAGVQRRLQEAGTYHVIAISGGNIAILAGLLLGGFRLAGWLGRTAMLIAIAALLVYAAFVGGGASVDRATLMAVVYFGGRAIDQRSPPLNALALVAAILVAADPLTVADPAFVLTFGATLAILVVVPAMTTINAEHAEHAEKGSGSAVSASSALKVVRRHLLPMFAASVAAEALLFPVGALTFSRVTFAGLALNFFAIPLMGVAQIAGMAVVPLAIVSRAGAGLAGWVAHLGAAGLVQSADLVRFAPVLTYRVAPPAWIAVAVYYGAASVWWWVPRRGISRGAAGVAVGAALWILVNPWALLASRGDGRLHVTFLDVGQGDSALVVFPRGSTLLVDAGGLASESAFDLGDRVVAPVVREAGVRRLDYVALTHGDPDHIGGAASMLREFRPREVWEGIPVPRFAPLTALRMAAQADGARWANVYRGDRVTIEGVEVVARHPAPAGWERQKVRNDDSLVLELRWRDVSVVLAGDVGRAVERDVAAAIPPAHLRVIKIPHHGSQTSSTPAFIAALHPVVAVASTGRSNHFGHPVPEVLERYRSAGAEVFRTDRDGAVTVETDGLSIDVTTFLGRRMTLH